ncbi:hypothetical protein BCR33DRAFT_764763, partial [Rhizoclosmatium globosum]
MPPTDSTTQPNPLRFACIKLKQFVKKLVSRRSKVESSATLALANTDSASFNTTAPPLLKDVVPLRSESSDESTYDAAATATLPGPYHHLLSRKYSYSSISTPSRESDTSSITESGGDPSLERPPTTLAKTTLEIEHDIFVSPTFNPINRMSIISRDAPTLLTVDSLGFRRSIGLEEFRSGNDSSDQESDDDESDDECDEESGDETVLGGRSDSLDRSVSVKWAESPVLRPSGLSQLVFIQS